MQDEVFHLDEAAARRQIRRHAPTYREVDFLAREAGRRMDERLDMVLHQPTSILDLGCGSGGDLELLRQRFPQARIIGLDHAPEMLRQIPRETSLLKRLLKKQQPTQLAIGRAQALPFRSASLSMVWSNLMLQWLDDPAPALREAHRALEVGGLLTFSTLGPDTLQELRCALGDQRVHRFIDMHDLGDELVRAGFADPVMDMEIITLQYESPQALIRDLRLSGSANANALRPKGLRGRHGFETLSATVDSLRQGDHLPVSVELIQGHAWKAAPKQTEDGRAIVRFMPRPA